MSLELKNVSYVYGAKTPFEKKALDCLDLQIKDGAITGLIGHTGSGKSTVAQLLNGLYTPTSGNVILDGVDINSSKKTLYETKFKVGLVFQYPEYQLFEETVAKDIAYGPKNMGCSDAEIRERVIEAAKFVGLSSAMMNKSPFELSGGQKRRAAIAGILAMRPSLLVLDEPAAGLDPKGRDDILSKIARYREEMNSSVLIISHSMEDMAKYCDEIIVMNKGKVYMKGTPDSIFANPLALRDVGLNVPQITKLMYKLSEAGITFSKPIYTVQDAYTEIMKVLKERGKL